MINTEQKAQHKEKRIKNFDEVVFGITKRMAIEEARRYPQYSKPELHPHTALGVDIPGFIRLLREGNVNAALRKLRERNVLVGVCSRICPPFKRPEEVIKEQSVSVDIDIRKLERFVADHGRITEANRKPTGKKIAVIGSGPAGLAAAAHLVRLNYQVTVFEALPLVGGKLRQYVPSFRLPRQTLKREIEAIEKMGVKIQTGVFVGSSVSIEQLWTEGFEAALLTVGLGEPKRPDIGGIFLSGVFSAEDFLLQCNIYKSAQILQKLSIKIGDNIVVCGRNEQAMDAARVLVRLGKTVKVVSSGTEEDWFDPREQNFAKEEGVEFISLSEITKIVGGANGHVEAVRCRQLDYADPDSNGQWQILPVPDSEFELETDTVIFSSGQKYNPYLSKWFGDLKRDADGFIDVDEKTGLTSVEKTFAAGEAVNGPMRVDEIMADGIRAADQIHNFFNGVRDESTQDD